MAKRLNHTPAARTPQGEAAASAYHTTVLLHETVDALDIQPDGVYVDCTFGGGGHSKYLLSKLGPKGKLIAFDQDDDAKRNLPADDRVVFIPENFRYLHRFLRLHQLLPVDGVLADLGVSSHQFDEASRGFSIRFDAPLDMRMDVRQGKTAADVLKTATEAELHKIFERYGEVTNAKTLAKTLVQARQMGTIQTILQFQQVMRPIVKGNPNRYFAQVFQALRIAVNEELQVLEELLVQLPMVLKPGAKASIITFHSLEDRLVKQFFKRGYIEEEENTGDPFAKAKAPPLLEPAIKKPIVPGAEEMKANSRSRSAKLRVAKRTDYQP